MRQPVIATLIGGEMTLIVWAVILAYNMG